MKIHNKGIFFLIFGSKAKNAFQTISRSLAIQTMIPLPPARGGTKAGYQGGDSQSLFRQISRHLAILAMETPQLMNMHDPPESYKRGQVSGLAVS